MAYRIGSDGNVYRIEDGALIPQDEANADYREFVAWQAGGGEPEPAPPTQAPVPAPISDRQFARGLWGDGIITFEECEAFCATGVIPAAMQALIDQLPDDATGAPTPRKEAIIFVRGAKEYRRDHPLVATLSAAFGWTPEAIDQKWREWAAL